MSVATGPAVAQTVNLAPVAPAAMPATQPEEHSFTQADSQALAKRLRERVARPGGLTADDVARRAVATSNEDPARKADIESAAAEVDRAKVGYYPKLTVTARYTRLSPITPPSIGPDTGSLVATPGGPGPLPPGAPLVGVPSTALTFPVILDQYLLQANVIVPLSDYLLRIRQSHAAAEESEEAAKALREASLRTVGANARLSYYGWARARMAQAVTEQSVEQSKRHLELSRAARDTGRMPPADVMRAESLLASAELMNERTKNAALVAEERLRTLLHDSGQGSYEIGEDLLAPLDAASAGDAAALYAEAMRKRPEMRAFERNENAIREQRAAARAGDLPRLDAFGNAYLANPNNRIFPQREEWKATWDLGVQLTWSPNDLGGSGAAARSLDAKRKRLDAERAALSDAIRDEIAAAIVAWNESRVAAATADRGLAAAEEAYRVRRELFELGRGTSVELIDAESDVLRARLEMIQAHVDSRVAKVRLEHAVGRDGPSP